MIAADGKARSASAWHFRLPTGFSATYGAGQPLIAGHTEYDSCPAPGAGRQGGIVRQAGVAGSE